MNIKFKNKRYGKLFLVLFLCFFSSSPADAKLLKFKATTPWLSSLTAFIGGVNVKVISMTTVTARGNLVRVKLQKEQRELPFIALDEEEANFYRLSNDGSRGFQLYETFPLEGRDSYYYDPSVLPFVTQRILVALAEEDPARYWYYQRRLAEFQARLETTLSLGRKLLIGGEIVDFTGRASTLFTAVGCSVYEPSKEIKSELKNLIKTRAKDDQIEEAIFRWLGNRDVIIMPSTVDERIKKASYKTNRVVFFDIPRPDSDFLLDIYNYYLSAWNVLRSGEH